MNEKWKDWLKKKEDIFDQFIKREKKIIRAFPWGKDPELVNRSLSELYEMREQLLIHLLFYEKKIDAYFSQKGFSGVEEKNFKTTLMRFTHKKSQWLEEERSFFQKVMHQKRQWQDELEELERGKIFYSKLKAFSVLKNTSMLGNCLDHEL